MSSPWGTKSLRSLSQASVLGLGLFVGSAGVSATAGWVPQAGAVAQTGGETVCQAASFGNYKLLDPEAPRTGSAAIDLPEGLVTITKAHSWDGYPTRVEHLQGAEVWEVEFLGASGSVVGVSATTGDLADGVIEAHWNGSLGSVTLSAPAVAVRAHHRPDLAAGGGKDSVHADGITVCYTSVPATTIPLVTVPTTLPSTTAPSTTAQATTVPTPTTTVPATAPPTTAAPTAPPTTTAPTTAAPTTAPPPSGPTITAPTTAVPILPTTVPTSVEGVSTVFVATTAPAPQGPSISQPTVSNPAMTESAAPPPKGPLFAYTGAETASLAAAGVALVGSGFFLMALRRKRTLAS